MTNECIKDKCFCWNFGRIRPCKTLYKKNKFTECPFPISFDDDEKDETDYQTEI